MTFSNIVNVMTQPKHKEFLGGLPICYSCNTLNCGVPFELSSLTTLEGLVASRWRIKTY